MKNKKRLLIIPLFLISNLAYGGFPTINAPKIAADIKGNIAKIGEGISKSGLMDQAMILGKEMFSLENITKNNGSANFVARKNAAKQNVQNLEIAEQQEASFDVCKSVSFSFSIGETGCKSKDASRNEVSDAQIAAYMNNDDVAKAQLANELVDNIQGTNPEMFGEEDSSNSSDPAPTVYSTNSTPMFSSADAYTSLDFESFVAMRYFLSLIVPDYSWRATYGDLQLMTRDEELEFIALESKRAIPEQVLKSLLAIRTSESALSEAKGESSGNPTSKLYNLGEAIKSSASDSALMALSMGDASTPTQLYRKRTLNLVNAVRLQIEQFKHGLDQEAMLATKLSFMINK